MDEAEWLSCTDPRLMLEVLRGRASDRKLLLFACACCRRIWPARPGGRALTPAAVAGRLGVPLALAEVFADRERRDRAAVDAAERFADGEVSAAEFRAAVRAAAHNPAGLLAGRDPVRVAAGVAGSAADTVPLAGPAYLDAHDPGRSPCGLLRDVVGPLPFRPVALAPAPLAWRDGTVRRLARSIYDERAFERMPVLADALEEAGCTDPDILGHLRGAGTHVRGCFAVDAVLGKS